jgi:hypothetical protein
MRAVCHEIAGFMTIKSDHTPQMHSYLSPRKAVGWIGISRLTKGGTLYPDKPTKNNKMEREENLVKVFTGPEPTALLLMKRLEETGIKSLIKNDSGLGYLGAVPAVIDLYIFEEDMEKARSLIEEMNEQQEEEETEE